MPANFYTSVGPKVASESEAEPNLEEEVAAPACKAEEQVDTVEPQGRFVPAALQKSAFLLCGRIALLC